MRVRTHWLRGICMRMHADQGEIHGVQYSTEHCRTRIRATWAWLTSSSCMPQTVYYGPGSRCGTRADANSRSGASKLLRVMRAAAAHNCPTVESDPVGFCSAAHQTVMAPPRGGCRRTSVQCSAAQRAMLLYPGYRDKRQAWCPWLAAPHGHLGAGDFASTWPWFKPSLPQLSPT